MSESAWLITHSARRYEQLNAAVSANLKRTGGNALVPVSAMRSLLSATAANEIRRAQPEAGLDKILRGMGAQEARPIGDGEVLKLLAWRDPIELPPRPAPAAAAGSTARGAGKLDWHLADTGFGNAWQRLGGANAIDYGNVIVGQIDTGFTQHPALGWKQGSSQFVLTDRDRNFFYEELSPHPEIPSFVFGSPYSAEDPLTGAFGGHGTRTASVLAGHYEAENFFGAAPRVPDNDGQGFWHETAPRCQCCAPCRGLGSIGVMRGGSADRHFQGGTRSAARAQTSSGPRASRAGSLTGGRCADRPARGARGGGDLRRARGQSRRAPPVE